MLIQIQAKFKAKVTPFVFSLNTNEHQLQITENETAHSDIYIGDYEYLAERTTSKDRRHAIAIVLEQGANWDQIVKVTAQFKTVSILNSQLSEVSSHLISIRAELNSKKNVENIKLDIQKKRKELELLNEELKLESDFKIQSLEKAHDEETEKNQNEKSLLHFLDFIQTESLNDDFLEKLFRFLWKDLKKIVRLQSLGVSYQNKAQFSRLIFFDGHQQLSLSASVDFKLENLPQQFATLLGRPVGSLLSWVLPKNSRDITLFSEVVDQRYDVLKLNNYFSERIAILSLYLDRWLIEKEFELIVNRWKSTFKSFAGYTHVIDDQFNIYHANYLNQKNMLSVSTQKCYQELAGRNEPCESCPVLTNQNTNLVFKEQQLKTYYSQFKYENKNFYFFIYEDMTKLVSLQSQIIQTEKMSTLGRLGNHLAHEMNNPLAGIKSYVQTILQDGPVLESMPLTATTDLNEILKATVRCQKIIKNFIDFSQKKEPSREPVVFQEVLQNTLVLLKSAFRNHRIFVDLKNEKIMANSHDLQQVLFNIIKNACQAMKTQGAIKVYQEIRGSQVYYYVEDSGNGFAESVMKNIFQPFTTTKVQGEGTGLGLYLSKKLIHNMQGDMQITSSDKGAKVILIFDLI